MFNGTMEFKDGYHKYNLFVSLYRPQLESTKVPQRFWQTLCRKLEFEVFDAENSFSIFKIDYKDEFKAKEDPTFTLYVSEEGGIQCDDPSQIYLIEHAWTCQIKEAIYDLIEIPGLLDRMCELMGISSDGLLRERVENIHREMWRYNLTYSEVYGNPEHRVPVWYVMDEFGSAITHSEEPNFRIVPFYYIHNETTYSLLFPIKNANFRETVTRNFLEGPLRDVDLIKEALLIPWKPRSFLDVSFVQGMPDDKYFLTNQLSELLPCEQTAFQCDETRVLKVYSEYNLINTCLTHPGFEIVDLERKHEADILWLSSHFTDYKSFQEESPHKFINQFPYESLLTLKNLFAAVCRRKMSVNVDEYSDNPLWLPTTYDLRTDLIRFVSCFQNREKNKLNNFWICKPCNSARGFDTVITDNLNCIVRLPSSGRKIAQIYLHEPILFNRADAGLVKFDIRYFLLLNSMKPLCVYAYKNFFLHFANRPYGLSDFWDEQKHLSIMNNEERPFFEMSCDEFVVKFSEQNPELNWSDIEQTNFAVFREIFEAASAKPPPYGIGHNPQSRALYTVDLMLCHEKTEDERIIVTPKILEINWFPECERACAYYPSFFNDVFSVLFKNTVDHTKFIAL